MDEDEGETWVHISVVLQTIIEDLSKRMTGEA